MVYTISVCFLLHILLMLKVKSDNFRISLLVICCKLHYKKILQIGNNIQDKLLLSLAIKANQKEPSDFKVK